MDRIVSPQVFYVEVLTPFPAPNNTERDLIWR